MGPHTGHTEQLREEGSRGPPGPTAPSLVFMTCPWGKEEPQRRRHVCQNGDDPKRVESTASSAWGHQASQLSIPPDVITPVHTPLCTQLLCLLSPVLPESCQMGRGESSVCGGGSSSVLQENQDLPHPVFRDFLKVTENDGGERNF